MPLRLLYVILTPPGPTQEFIELEDSEGKGVGDVPMERDPRSSDDPRLCGAMFGAMFRDIVDDIYTEASEQ